MRKECGVDCRKLQELFQENVNQPEVIYTQKYIHHVTSPCVKEGEEGAVTRTCT